jgi:hypothetical protein
MDAPDEKRPKPSWGPETVTADGGANILGGHETAALSKKSGALRSTGVIAAFAISSSTVF